MPRAPVLPERMVGQGLQWFSFKAVDRVALERDFGFKNGYLQPAPEKI